MAKRFIRVPRRPLRCWFGRHQWLLHKRWGIEGEDDAVSYECWRCHQLGYARLPVGSWERLDAAELAK